MHMISSIIDLLIQKIFPVDSLCIQYSYDCSEEGNQEEGISR